MPQALIRHAATDCWLAFARPVGVLEADAPEAVPRLLEQVERRVRAQGLYAVGWVSYEAAPGLEVKLPTHPPGRLAPAWFALFDRARRVPAPVPESGPLDLHWQPSIDAAGYREALARIHDYIGAGDTYQVNFSYRLRAATPGDDHTAWRLFRHMIARQPAGHGAYIDAGARTVCSASHELFFARRGRQLVSRPMKGTAPRGATPDEDAARARWLCRSLKNRAENLMITDMVRNDLGRLARVGTVRTESLFRLEPYPTLWQLTSTVTGETDAGLAEIFRALFPAASITGAPKRRTMEIIRELEDQPREIYTGTVGLLTPDGDAEFNVAIRTALVDQEAATAEYGIGGGILWDSDAGEEYEETRTKARILNDAQPPASTGFALLETLLWEPDDGYYLLDAHLERLTRSARALCRPVDAARVAQRLAERASSLPPQPHRVRLQVHHDGRVEVEAAVLDPDQRPRRVAIAPGYRPVLDNPFVAHKTTHRDVYDRARHDARAHLPEAEDVLLVNERGELTESTIANLVVELDGELVTPAAASGLLPGVYRQMLLDSGAVVERVLRPADLEAADRVYLANSVRGLWAVTLIDRGAAS
ncbi:MAG: aminodeoxychorismate synthase component I [Pseudomonadota bacterium]